MYNKKKLISCTYNINIKYCIIMIHSYLYNKYTSFFFKQWKQITKEFLWNLGKVIKKTEKTLFDSGFSVWNQWTTKNGANSRTFWLTRRCKTQENLLKISRLNFRTPIFPAFFIRVFLLLSSLVLALVPSFRISSHHFD